MEIIRINNAAKYSNASLISVTVKLNETIIDVAINDNGCGFETSILKGNGLGNIKKRTEELKGTFSITSEKNKGTFINVKIPFVT